MKAQIITLLETTNKSYRLIAHEVQCTEQYVRTLHNELIRNRKLQANAK